MGHGMVWPLAWSGLALALALAWPGPPVPPSGAAEWVQRARSCDAARACLGLVWPGLARSGPWPGRGCRRLREVAPWWRGPALWPG